MHNLQFYVSGKGRMSELGANLSARSDLDFRSAIAGEGLWLIPDIIE